MTKAEKAVFQLVETTPIDGLGKTVYSLLALYPDGKITSSRFAYDVARGQARAEKILSELKAKSPQKDEFIDFICDIL